MTPQEREIAKETATRLALMELQIQGLITLITNLDDVNRELLGEVKGFMRPNSFVQALVGFLKVLGNDAKVRLLFVATICVVILCWVGMSPLSPIPIIAALIKIYLTTGAL